MAYPIMNFPGNLEKAVTLSYDDGVEQDIKLMSILDKYGLKCTFNINTGRFSPEGTVYEEGKVQRIFTQSAALDLYTNCGHEIAVHTLNHTHLESLPIPRVVEEVIGDRLNIEHLFGKITRGMAYPYGNYDYSDELVNALHACGIAYSRTTLDKNNFTIPTDWLRLRATCRHGSAELPRLTEKFIGKKNAGSEPWLFYLWGHSYEFERDNNWEVIENFASAVGGRDDVWYATNIEVYDYVEAFRALIYSTDGKIVYNPTAQKLFFSIGTKRYCVAPGETVNI